MLSLFGLVNQCSKLMIISLPFSWNIFLMLHDASVTNFLHMIRMLHLKIFETILLFMMGIVVSSLRLTIISNSRLIRWPLSIKLDNCLRWTSKILTRGAFIWYLLWGLTLKWRDRLPESESCITLHHWACVMVPYLIIRMILMS